MSEIITGEVAASPIEIPTPVLANEEYKPFHMEILSNTIKTVGIRIQEEISESGHLLFFYPIIVSNGVKTSPSNSVAIDYAVIFTDSDKKKLLENKKRELVNVFMAALHTHNLEMADGKTIINKKNMNYVISDYIFKIFEKLPETIGAQLEAGHKVWQGKYPNTYFMPSTSFMLRTKALADRVCQDLGVIATDDGTLYTYESGVYVIDDKAIKVKKYINDLLGDNSRTMVEKEVIAYIVNKYSVKIDTLINNSDIVNFKNGYYDLNEKIFKPHDKSFQTIFQLNADYVEGKNSCPQITKFLIDILPDEIDRNLILDYLAYCLIPDVSLQKALFMLGGGSNGKTKLLDLFKKLIGDASYCSLSIQELEKEKFSRIRLLDKLVNICGDMPPDMLDKCEVFKSVTGGDDIQGERKYKDPLDFTAKTRMLLAMNHCPIVRESTDIGYFRRIVLIRFKRNFEEERDANGNLIKDTGIMKRLTTPEELSGFMSMLIGRLQVMHDRMIESGKGYTIENMPSDEETKRRYNINSFSERQFTDDALTHDSTTSTSTDNVYNAYLNWCSVNKEKPVTQRKLENVMTRTLGFRIVNSNKSQGTYMVYEGLRLKSEFKPKDETTSTGIDLVETNNKIEDDRKRKLELDFWNEYWRTANVDLVSYEYSAMMRKFYQRTHGENYPTEDQVHESQLAMWNANHPDDQKTEYMPWMTKYAKNPEAYDKELSDHRARCEAEKEEINARALQIWNNKHPEDKKIEPDEKVWELYRTKYFGL